VSDNDSLKAENLKLLEELNNMTMLVSDLSSESQNLADDIEELKKVMRVSKENLLDFFGVQFKSFSNRSLEYALFSFNTSQDWNFGDQVCLAVQSELAFPVASNHESIEDLKASCPYDHDLNCCSCWVGLTKQTDGATWTNSNGVVIPDIKIFGSLWASGQPKDDDGYDCVYIRDNIMYSEFCAVSFQSSNATSLPTQFVCEGLVS